MESARQVNTANKYHRDVLYCFYGTKTISPLKAEVQVGTMLVEELCSCLTSAYLLFFFFLRKYKKVEETKTYNSMKINNISYRFFFIVGVHFFNWKGMTGSTKIRSYSLLPLTLSQ